MGLRRHGSNGERGSLSIFSWSCSVSGVRNQGLEAKSSRKIRRSSKVDQDSWMFQTSHLLAGNLYTVSVQNYQLLNIPMDSHPEERPKATTQSTPTVHTTELLASFGPPNDSVPKNISCRC